MSDFIKGGNLVSLFSDKLRIRVGAPYDLVGQKGSLALSQLTLLCCRRFSHYRSGHESLNFCVMPMATKKRFSYSWPDPESIRVKTEVMNWILLLNLS